MRSVCAFVCGAAALASLASFASAEVVKPVAYSMANGNTGSYHYWDDTYTGSGDRNQDGSSLSGGLGQLTDDVLGTDSWSADLGNGNAFEWVGWVNVNPVITFEFSDAVSFTEIAVHANNQKSGGVGIFTSFIASFSNDGVNYTSVFGRDVSQSERADTSARFYSLSLPEVSAKYVQLYFYSGSQWTFVSEVTFAAIPAPSATGLLALAGLAATRRRR